VSYAASEVIGVELGCKGLAESRDFFTGTLGLLISEQTGTGCQLRCVGEDLFGSVHLQEGDGPAIRRLTLRGDVDAVLQAPPVLGDFEVAVVASPPRAPRYAGARPVLNQPTPLRGIGVEPRRLDHVAFLVADLAAAADWLVAELGFAVRETVTDDHGQLLMTLAVSSQACDVMLLRGRPDVEPALHHIAFAVDQRDAIARAALLLAERAVPIETGLGQHGVAQMSYLYCFEPSGMRVSLSHSPIVVHDPRQPAVEWPPEARDRALMLWGAPTPESFFEPLPS
jgi:catechol 2,3-dioxygenase-like lactoylglutathione lyase family enzyme